MKRVVCIWAALEEAFSFWNESRAAALTVTRSVGDSPAGLTVEGQLLWNFEGLLKMTFGRRQSWMSCIKSCQKLDFSCPGGCFPLAVYNPYWYTFARPHGSTFHISSKKPGAVFFGSYPVPVLIRRRLIACDAYERRFLIEYSNAASFTLGCFSAQSLLARSAAKVFPKHVPSAWQGRFLQGTIPRAAESAGPPAQLTVYGRRVWNFEGLLAGNFVRRRVVSATGLNFTCAGFCTPMSNYRYYFYVFARPHGSSFHISSRGPKGLDFGNYPIPCSYMGG